MKIHLIDRSTIILNDEVISLGDLSITQGISYNLTLFIQGNYSNWIPKGQIRTNYVDAGGVIETEFLFKDNLYLSSENITFIRPYLNANLTKELISTTYQAQEDQEPNEENCFFYNLVLINPASTEDNLDIISIVDTSFVQIKPGVTI